MRETIAAWKAKAGEMKNYWRAEQALTESLKGQVVLQQADSQKQSDHAKSVQKKFDELEQCSEKKTKHLISACVTAGVASIVCLFAVVASLQLLVSGPRPVEVILKQPAVMGVPKTTCTPTPALDIETEPQAQSEYARAALVIGGCSGTPVLVENGVAWGVSAAHCVNHVGEQARTRTQSGKRSIGTFVVVDQKRDIAIFCMPASGIDATAPIASAPKLTKGATVEQIGFPGNTSPRRLRTSRLTYDGTRDMGRFSRAYYRGRESISGESGCAIFCDGEVVGVLSKFGDCRATCYSDFRAFLESARGPRTIRVHANCDRHT